ncbi:MAG: AMP-binding protein, partial [Pseudomonadota bacterium]
ALCQQPGRARVFLHSTSTTVYPVTLIQQLWEHAYFPFFEGFVKRRQTHNLYRKALDTQWLPRGELEHLQLTSVNELLAHAKKRVPFYKESGSYPHRVSSLAELNKLPILTKTAIRKESQRLLAQGKESSAWWKATGGSTGEPLKFAHDLTSHEWRTAMSLRGYSWAGALPGTRQAYLWGIPSQPQGASAQLKEKLHQMLDRKRFYNCFDFGPTQMRRCYEELRTWKPQVIVAYTNAAYELARFIEQQELAPLEVDAVICGAEKVHPTQREKIRQMLASDVFDTYGSREFMLMAAECEKHEGLHVSMENVIVEVVDDDNQAVGDGETGRILVTDLHNYTMPFIRYEVGDLAKMSSRMCSCGRQSQLLEEIVGRSLDVIRMPDGRVIPGELFPHLMKDFPQVQRFRLHQKADYSLNLFVVTQDNGLDDTAEASIREGIFRLAKSDVPVTITVLDELPLTRSGKHRVTVSDVPQ